MGDSYGSNIYKVRLADESKGRGKSGGFRVITYLVDETPESIDIYLITIFDKSEESSINKDQNISHRIVPQIAFLFDALDHVKTNAWTDWKDYDIFMHARHLEYDAIITLDDDFNKLLLVHGTPPKIIWLKTGNCSTSKLAAVILSHKEVIHNFLLNTAFDCLELYG